MARKKDYLRPWLERLGMTIEEVAEKYRAWYQDAVKYMGRDAAVKMLAAALHTSEGSAYRYRKKSELPAGEFLALVCHRLEKAQGFELELGDKALDNTILTLHQDWRADMVSHDAEHLRRSREALDERERGLAERERKLDERDEELDGRTERLEWRSKLVDGRERSVTEHEREAEEREKAVEEETERLRRLGRPTTEQEVIAVAMKRKSRLAPSIKSALLVKLESDEEVARGTFHQLDITQATKRRVRREEKERVLAILTFPIRLLVDWLMP